MRRGSLFWGIIIVLAGVLLLLNQFGLLPVNAWALFWPILLILLGVWFLLSPVLGRRDIKDEAFSLPLDGANEAEIRIRHGAGRLEMTALPLSGDLLSGTFTGGVYEQHSRQGSTLRLRMQNPDNNVMFGWPSMPGPLGYHWNMALVKNIPLKLDLKTGASDTELDLSELKVTELELETGASSNQITLPAHAGYTRLRVKAGAASVKIRVPDGVAARIHYHGGLSGIDIDTVRFPFQNNFYQTPGYDAAANRVEMDVETGVGSVEIR
ncbi:MAG: DUF5668 domain-containing protein [Anaerolineaceae bacterium]|nr:DUF5668 domain-containing protein [Anaerolineaceae bacterium]